MRTHFDLFLYVSKSAPAAGAAHVCVPEDNADGLKLAYEWTASTGREKVEVNAQGRSVITATRSAIISLIPGACTRATVPPAGIRICQHHVLRLGARGSQTGLAIHAAVQADIAKLGGRASGGCVHLAPTMRRRFTDIDPSKLSRDRAALCLRSRNPHRQQSGRLHARPQAADCA
jgi:lipoprotein-anchoring transpeptidase ErfK/SrfK